MKLIVVSDAHLFMTADGCVWCNTAMHGYEFWKRYTSSFEEVIVVARTKKITEEEREKNSYILAGGSGVSFYPLPFVRGFKGYIFGGMGMINKCCKVRKKADAGVFRIPSFPAYICLNFFARTKKPYFVEVVIDPEDEYKDYNLIKKISMAVLKYVCKKANGVSYVTKEYLQKKYPSAKALNPDRTDKYETYYSSIELNDNFFCRERIIRPITDKLIIVHIANSINNYNKGHDVVLMIAERLNKIIDTEVYFIGNGDLVDHFRNIAKEKGILDKIHFVGYVSEKKIIRDYLIKADLFVFPTKAEGLPRALIEAMATGTPCLSSNVDGIPELLDKEYLFEYNNVDGYTRKITELISDLEQRKRMSVKNIEKALEYESEILSERRRDFYEKLYQCCKQSEKV